MTFFLCYDPDPRDNRYYYPIINLDLVVFAHYSPSISNDDGDPIFELHLQASKEVRKMTISGRDAARLLDAMDLFEPPHPKPEEINLDDIPL